MAYIDSSNGNLSSIDVGAGNTQIRQEYYNKKAIIEVKDEMILSQMGDSSTQPKHYGKEVVRHRYIPLLDDENSSVVDTLDNGGASISNGNLYGSSRSIGVLTGKLPDLNEDSERINQVGFSRKEVRGNIVNRGFFFEWTKDEVNFDSDPKWKENVTREAVRGAAQINEDVLAIELINGAGINMFAGDANTLSTIDHTSVPTLRDLYALDTELDNNKCPKDTTIIAGSRLVDTKTVAAARYIFITPEQKMDYMSIEALDSTATNPKMAFVPVEQYADGAKGSGKYIKSIHGEIGKVGPFRVVVNPKMLKYSDEDGTASGAAFGKEVDTFTLVTATDALDTGKDSIANVIVSKIDSAGAAIALTLTTDYTVADGVVTIVDTAATDIGDSITVSYDAQDDSYLMFKNDGSNYEVYASLVVGSGCFTHIGFEYGAGTKGKFDVVTMTPEQLRTKENVYAKTGMTVVEFWNGVLIARPDHLAVYNTNSQY